MQYNSCSANGRFLYVNKFWRHQLEKGKNEKIRAVKRYSDVSHKILKTCNITIVNLAITQSLARSFDLARGTRLRSKLYK